MKKNPLDKVSMRTIADSYVALGDWPKALESYAKLGCAAAKFEIDAGTVVDYDNLKAADFWWDYNATDKKPFKIHAAELYRLAIEQGGLDEPQRDIVCKRMENARMLVANIVQKDSKNANVKKVQLWEGGPCWADRNIGADNPYDYGYHFWWGDTVGYMFKDGAWVASDKSSLNFSFTGSSALTLGKDIATLQREGWVTGDKVLAPEHDAAHVHWGGAWRMPTIEELRALCTNCDLTKITRDGVKGYVVRGRGNYASASIFLPRGGYGLGFRIIHADVDGNYWSSVPCSNSERAWFFFIAGAGGFGLHNYDRSDGLFIRPVQGENAK